MCNLINTTQDGNGDGSEDEAGTETGVEIRGRSQHGNGEQWWILEPGRGWTRKLE